MKINKFLKYSSIALLSVCLVACSTSKQSKTKVKEDKVSSIKSSKKVEKGKVNIEADDLQIGFSDKDEEKELSDTKLNYFPEEDAVIDSDLFKSKISAVSEKLQFEKIDDTTIKGKDYTYHFEQMSLSSADYKQFSDNIFYEEDESVFKNIVSIDSPMIKSIQETTQLDSSFGSDTSIANGVIKQTKLFVLFNSESVRLYVFFTEDQNSLATNAIWVDMTEKEVDSSNLSLNLLDKVPEVKSILENWK